MFARRGSVSPWLGPLVACLLCPAEAAQAEQAESKSTLPERRGLAFNPCRDDRCRYFLVTEFSASVAGRTSQDPVDSFIFSDALGVMKNFPGGWSLGGSLDAHLARGTLKWAPTLRYKRWLSARQSVDVVAGYVLDRKDGLIGPIASVRYSPAPWAHLQAGVCQDRERRMTYDPQNGTFQLHDRTQFRAHAGLGLGGVPGLVSWGLQAIGGLAVAAFASAMY